MIAAEARQLKINDEVVAAWSNSHRVSVIKEIQWPHFTIETVLASGETKQRKARYSGLYNTEYYCRTYGQPKGIN